MLTSHLPLLATVLLAFGLAVPADSQSPPNCNCPDIPQFGDPSGLAVGNFPVKVFAPKGTSFTKGQLEQIQSALDQWGSLYGVAFGRLEVVQQDPGYPDGFITIVYQKQLLPGSGWTQLYHPGDQGDLFPTGARIELNPGSDKSAFFSVVIHEPGHMFFLGDCEGCSGSLTSMKDPPTGADDPTAPTDCDRMASAKYSGNRYPVPGFELIVEPVVRDILAGKPTPHRELFPSTVSRALLPLRYIICLRTSRLA